MRKSLHLLFIFLFIFLLIGGCGGIPVRKEVRVDLSLPVGKIEGNAFQGIRFPFKVSLPSPNWKFSVEIPDFMEGLGFKRPGLEESELFIINPATKSNIQIDLTPAGRTVRFDQKLIHTLTASGAGGLVEELKMEHGRDFPVQVGPTTPYALKGVPYAAHRSARYKVEGTNTIHGWVYGFAEPYQTFIIYMILEKEGYDDLKDIMKILGSFEMVPKK
ncbi:MAG: hypothetical protein A2026_17455 [Deltaproteobacteria bacterium RBG_19FT_COMBO_46_12]|nr:MAG: hypothetical protein A2026_17455 [Deltaproteobacteria bacterium RBG_19FT_COMBO_46_12]